MGRREFAFLDYKMKKCLVFSLLFLAFACSNGAGQKPIARVGDVVITPAEFRKRFELNPRMLQYRDVEWAKQRYLGSLIAEKLLALDELSRNPEPPPRTRALLAQLQREAVIEEFFNREVEAKIHPSDAELRQAYRASKREVQLQYASFDNQADALQFIAFVRQGRSFADMLTYYAGDGPAGSLAADTLSLKWGVADPKIEQKLLSLKLGEISEPIPSGGTFYVAQVISESVDPFQSEQEFLQNKPRLEKVLRQRRRRQESLRYFKQLMVGKKTEVPPERFKQVVEGLEQAFGIGGESGAAVRVQNPAPLSETELQQAQSGVQNLADAMLVRFDDGSAWTTRDFLQRLSVGRFYIDFRGRKAFRTSMRQALVTMIEQEYVYKEGAKRGFEQTPYVQQELAMWRQNLAAHRRVFEIATADSAAFDENAPIHLSEAQLITLGQTLVDLLQRYPLQIDAEVLRALPVTNAGLLLLKRQFPGRTVVPVDVPLENLPVWQETLVRYFQ